MLASKRSIGLKAFQSINTVRYFRTSIPTMVKVGDKIPSVKLFEGSPSDDLDAAKVIGSGKNLVVTVPGAFSAGCSQVHVPGYIENYSKFTDKGINSIFLIAHNDAFVVNSWNKTFEGNPGIRFLADPTGELADKLDLSFDATAFFGGPRYKRSAFVVDNGTVTKAFVEPDNTSVKESAADKVLAAL